MYDEEAIYQDADIEQAQFTQESNHLAALKRSGVCIHGGVVGLGADGEAHYPEAEGLVCRQVRCTDGCNRVFDSTEEWVRVSASF